MVQKKPEHIGGTVLAAALLLTMAATPVTGQALRIHQLANGTEMIQITQPLATATSVAWQVVGPGGAVQVQSLAAGTLTLAADLEARLGDGTGETAPPAIVLVGAAAGNEIDRLLDRLLAERPAVTLPVVTAAAVIEGGIEKRLGEPGSQAMLRLEMPMPEPGRWQRSALEVLWELLPELLTRDIAGLRSRVDGHIATLEARIDPELAELKLGQLRIALARLASQLHLDDEQTFTAVRRLMVRRQAGLEQHPDAAEQVLGWWSQGGVAAVREQLFGLNGVATPVVLEAAREWLPKHPGSAVLVLPPQVLNPRFATGPEQLHLANDLSVAILERPSTLLSVLCLRPVLLPDVDGELTALVLSRLATEIRANAATPGLVQVRRNPATLELAAPADGYAELCEVLQAALARIADDSQPVAAAPAEARRRALRLMAGRLGLGDETTLSPESLLRPDNIALGMVAQDGEAAVEALRKLLLHETTAAEAPQGQSIFAGQRTRHAAPGSTSVLITALFLEPNPGETLVELVAILLASRGAALLPGIRQEVLQPLVPGRTVLLLLTEAEMTVAELELLVAKAWSQWLALPGEEELRTAQRQLAAGIAARSNGAVGAARRCAAVAAGVSPWRPAADLEMEALMITSEELAPVLEPLEEWAALPTTGAGLLPIITAEGTE